MPKFASLSKSPASVKQKLQAALYLARKKNREKRKNS